MTRIQIRIQLFVAKIRQQILLWRIRREIYHKIFPQLDGSAKSSYPFDSDSGLIREHMAGQLLVASLLRELENRTYSMPTAEADAFRYIAYRDLVERLEAYIEFAKHAEHPQMARRLEVPAPA